MNIAYFLLPKSRIAYLYDDFTFRQGLEKMRNRGYTAIPVITRDGRYVGTVSEGDFLWRLLDTDDPSMKKAEELALKMAGMLSLVAKIFAPLVWLLTASTNFWLRRFGIDPEEEEETVSEEEIRLLLAEGREQGTIPTEETEMIQNVFGFDDIAVGTICTHRREMVSLSTEEDEAVWDRILAESVHTYYPIFAGRSEDVVGILDGKAYFRMKDHTRDKVMQCAVQKPMLAADSMKANRLFEQMKQQQNYFAVVTDAYGGVTGIVTLCDIMEYLVGDLENTVTA